jgi:hypothetical protein
MYALVDLGTEEAFRVLLAALDGRTQVRPSHASLFVRGFVEENGWTPERVRRVPDALGILKRYIEREDFSTLVTRLARELALSEAVPKLRSFVRDEKYERALEAARAILAMTGDRVAMEPRHKAEFVNKAICEDLLRPRWKRPLVADGSFQARLARSADDNPVIVLAEYAGDANETHFHIVNHEGQASQAFEMPGVVKDFMPLGVNNEGRFDAVAVLVQPNRRARSNMLVTVSRTGSELWRRQPPAQEFLSLAQLYAPTEEPPGLLLSYWPEPDGLLALGLDGRTIWNTTTFVYAEDLRTYAWSPNRFVGVFQGSARLFASDGTLLSETDSREARVRDVAMLPGQNGEPLIIVTRELRDTNMHEVALLDGLMNELWTCGTGEPCRHVAVLTGPGGENPLILALSVIGEMHAIDGDGCLRWQGPLFDVDPLTFRYAYFNAIPATKGRPALIAAFCDKQTALWELRWAP